jgi:hypothetical protein
MSLTSKLLSASGGGITYVDDVFIAYTYTGNGGTQTINNGIDLAGKGGLVWTKSRDASGGHYLVDSATSLKWGQSNTTAAFSGPNVISSFNSTGYTLGINSGANSSASPLVSWTSRKAPKFFDVVTYTGTGVNRTVPHSLNSEVGTLIVKRTDTAADWQVYHRSAANTEYLVLNSTAAKATGATRWNSTTPTTGSFSLGTDVTVNANGGTYVAYLYAHDDSEDGIVKCGSFTTDGSGNTTVDLGWEPQYILWKNSDSAGSWFIQDNVRDDLKVGPGGKELTANTANAEGNGSSVGVTANGFVGLPGTTLVSSNCIYIAIRRSNKPPTVGTEVYNAIARTGTGAAATVTGVGFAPDLNLNIDRTKQNINTNFLQDRLRGATLALRTDDTSTTETAFTTGLTSFDMNGVSFGADTTQNGLGVTFINYFWKRALGVMDIVCDSGTGTAHSVLHSLTVSPELILRHTRAGGQLWQVYHSGISNTEKLILSSTATKVTDTTAWSSTTPSSLTFTIGTGVAVNDNSVKYVTYLFASKLGISKVFSYTGNGSSQTIDCGFTTGARFFLVKSTSVTGSWWVYDSVRGISAPADPALQLNSATAAEITSADAVDPHVSGVIVNQEGSCSINASGVTYIGLAFA